MSKTGLRVAPLAVDLVQRLLAAAGRADLEPIILGEATNEIPEQHLAAGKARRMLGWQPGWSLEAALEETVGWYRGWLAAPAS